MKKTTRQLLASAIAMTTMLTVAQPAAADINPNWPAACQSTAMLANGKWQFVLNFNGSQPTSCLVSKTITGVPSFVVRTCAQIGAIGYAGGVATFNGGHLRCAFNPPGAGTTKYDEFTVFARAEAQSYGVAINDNPIIVHPNAQLFLPRAASTSLTGMTTAFNGVQRNTMYASPTASGMHSFRGDFACTPACNRTHFADNLEKQTFAENAMLSFKLGAHAIHIGFDPATGKTFKGQVDLIVIDPQVRNDCC